jgi:hypothetical protein
MDDTEQHRSRALAAWEPVRSLLQRRRWRPPTLRDGPWPGAGTAAVWPLSQVIAAATDLVMLDVIGADELALCGAVLERYRDGDAYDPFPGSHPRYYDDNAWVGLDFVQQHLALPTERPTAWLDDAATLLAYLQSGEHPDGGVHWVEHPKESRHTCSTAPAGALAARLHETTGDDEALAFAARCAAFLTTRVRREDGIYEDNLRNDGSVGAGVYSYNQGTPVGLDVLLHRITGADEHLDRAQRSATSSLALYAHDDRLWRDSPAFNAIYFRNLLRLDAVSPLPAIRQLLSSYTERLWTEARDPATGWFTSGGIGAYERGGALDQAGITQLFAIQAMSADQIDLLC